jgi:glycosyltransferase involved in cell wall biosynthesis
MHVVHIVPTLGGDGAEARVRTIVPPLADRGLRLSVVSVYGAALDDAQRARLFAPLYEIGYAGPRDAPAAFMRLVWRLRSLRPDVVHGHVDSGKYLGRAAAIAAGVPRIVYTEHHSHPHAGRLHGAADRALRSATDAVIAFHECQRQTIAARDRIPLERIVVIPGGIAHRAPADAAARAEARERLGLGTGDFVVLYAARLTHVKDPQLAIRAFARTADDPRRRTVLLIAGTGPLAARVRTACEPLGERARMLGDHRDVPSLLAAADAFLVTSHSEAMPLGLIEAMGAGVPVVSTPFEGAHELLDGGEAGLVAREHAWEPLAAALALLRDRPAVAAALAERASQRARTVYDLATAARRHHELYTDLRSAHRR